MPQVVGIDKAREWGWNTRQGSRADQSPEQVARRYVEPNKGVMDAAAALEGARAILVERFSEDAMLIGTLREEVWSGPYLFPSSCR
jgi:transcriptional accessory protein Tex/SPT6